MTEPVSTPPLLRRPMPWGLAVAVALLLKTAFLGWMLWDRISILRSETEIVLRPQPVDPRDLFRGDYVILRYGISRWEIEEPESPETDPEAAPEQGRAPRPVPRAEGSLTAEIWAVIAQGEDGLWRVDRVEPKRPASLPAGQLVLRAASDVPDIRPGMSLRYGLERYYVPEGDGLALEQQIGETALQVVVAVAPDGRTAIKALRDAEGTLLFEEPWF
ncbi:MAG: GDYXXLXY domain-containing protein [Pseudomonadota bacterium]